MARTFQLHVRDHDNGDIVLLNRADARPGVMKKLFHDYLAAHVANPGVSIVFFEQGNPVTMLAEKRRWETGPHYHPGYRERFGEPPASNSEADPGAPAMHP